MNHGIKFVPQDFLPKDWILMNEISVENTIEGKQKASKV